MVDEYAVYCFSVTSSRGLHGRPSCALADYIALHRLEVTVGRKGTDQMVSGTNVMQLLTLGAVHGTELEFRIKTRPDLSELVEGIKGVLAQEFN